LILLSLFPKVCELMKVLLTGISGRVGRHCALDFLENGHQVRGFDRSALPENLRGKVEMVYGELTDRLTILKAAEDCDAICHLAAIPNPGHRDDIIFNTNITGTQYMLAAAEGHGIQKFVCASTCCTFGIFYAKHQFDPQYLPIDEKHPALPQDLYALSKIANEETCAAYTRRSGMTTVALRLTTVVNLQRMAENDWGARHFRQAGEWRSNDFWTYIDDRDCARAFRLALENTQGGSHVAIIAARDSLAPYDIRELIAQHFPGVADQVHKLDPHGCAYDTSVAENVFGFVAEHSWRDVPQLRAIAEEVKATTT
jgi:nucleoside-diphosphate-sugar epimerase